ncbi:MAG: dephospho-CoA kinase [Candidatus Omnitrophica bacterium]|nr:dephospho-CoA kinase [Candidatus Omnitrophota bacterium]
MLVVGLTGSLATGKSTVTAMFAALGAKVIDSDRVAHGLLKESGGCYKQVVKTFGPRVIGPNGIDRNKLAGIVFHDRRQLKRLEKIIHPKVRAAIKTKLAAFKKSGFHGIVVIEVPLLFESGFNQWMDTSIVVASGRARQLERAVGRLKLTRTQALRRIDAQLPLRDKIRLADIIIDNNGTRKETGKQVKIIWQKLTRRAKK